MAVRKALHAYLSEEAHDSWHQFAEDNSVSLSAVLTSFATAINEPSEGSVKQQLQAVVDQAHETQRQKRKERRRVIAQRSNEKANSK